MKIKNEFCLALEDFFVRRSWTTRLKRSINYEGSRDGIVASAGLRFLFLVLLISISTCFSGICIAGLRSFDSGYAGKGMEASPPSLSEPEDDERFTVTDDPPVFQWEDVQGASCYELEIGLDESFSITTGPMDVEETQFDLGLLINEDIWNDASFSLYWRVRSVDESDEKGDWSEIWNFHKSVLPRVILWEPLSGTRYTIGDALPWMRWEEVQDVQGYQVEFAFDAEFEESMTIAETWAPALDLRGGDQNAWNGYSGVVYWRVSAVGYDGVPGPWSSGWWFAKSLLARPQLNSPGPEARFGVYSNIVSFWWTDIQGAESWEFQIGLDGDFEEVAGSVLLDQTGLDLADMITFDDWVTTYCSLWWRVSGRTPDNIPGPWSEARKFTKLGLHRFLAWGDSITAGECVENGYANIMLPELQQIFHDAVIVNMGRPGAKSEEGERRMEEVIEAACPEFVFIQFGANDCVDFGNCNPPFQCDVDGHMRAMAEICRSYGATPIISTIIPMNPDGKHAWAQEGASDWNILIRELQWSIGVEVADMESWFFDYGNLPELYCYWGQYDPPVIDWIHPNELGYQIMSDCYLNSLHNVLGF